MSHALKPVFVMLLLVLALTVTGCSVDIRFGGPDDPLSEPEDTAAGTTAEGQGGFATIDPVPLPPAVDPGAVGEVGGDLSRFGGFEPSQAFVYHVMRGTDESITMCTFSMSFEEVPGDQTQLGVTYSVLCDKGGSGARVKVSADQPLADLMVADHEVAGLMSELFEVPWDQYFEEPRAAGDSWEVDSADGTLCFTLDETGMYAGYPGLSGEWSVDDEQVAKFSVNPDVPLPLYFRIGDEDNYVEYELAEGGSGPTIN